MGLRDRISAFFNKYAFNAKWRCLSCKREIFNGEYFCEKCKAKLPINDSAICQHCGRKLKKEQNFCTTCKGKLVSIDKARSAYDYLPPISSFIKNLKYRNQRFLAEAFGKDLAELYNKNGFNADFALFVPSTERSKKKRGYNQAELLAKEFCRLTELELCECLEKIKETDRQATLDRSERLKNLKDAFKVSDKKLVKDKKIVIIDDVTTTGATAQTIAGILKKVGAKEVYLLSVASVAPKDGY